jgi:hypothetical protein
MVERMNQVQQMVRACSVCRISHSERAADALAVAICHVHSARLKAMIDEDQSVARDLRTTRSIMRIIKGCSIGLLP